MKAGFADFMMRKGRVRYPAGAQLDVQARCANAWFDVQACVVTQDKRHRNK
jgi:hypothetical protein